MGGEKGTCFLSPTVALMHAKALIVGAEPIPALMVTSSQTDVLRGHLLDRGWVPLGEPLQPAAAGELRIGVDRLQVVIRSDVLLDDDANPASPRGWWEAVDTLGGYCVVVLVREGAVDLTRPQTGDQLVDLLHTGHALSAALPVVTSLSE